MSDLTDALDLPELKATRQARRQFLDRLEPLRSNLYKYCRRPTGNAFDAEVAAALGEPVELNGHHY